MGKAFVGVGADFTLAVATEPANAHLMQIRIVAMIIVIIITEMTMMGAIKMSRGKFLMFSIFSTVSSASREGDSFHKEHFKTMYAPSSSP